MKALSSLSARLYLPGLCVIATAASGCSFDSSQLRSLVDGAVEHSAQSDAVASAIDSTTASSPDAAPRAGGSGGSAGTAGSGGVGVDARTATDGMAEAGGRTSSGDAAVPPDLARAFDVPTPFEATPPPDAAMDAPLAVDAISIPDATSVSTLGLVLYYSCDQINGTTVPDMSGNGNNGTLVGPVSIGPGKVGNALVLTASNSVTPTSGGYVAMPPAILATARDMTIATWFKVNSTLSNQRIFDIGTSSTTSSMFLTPTYTTGNLHFTIRMALADGGLDREDIDATSTVIPTGQWEHVALVLDASGGRLYLNGVQVGTNTAMPMVPEDLGATPNDWIGRSEFSSNPYLDGAIDEFRIYNRALSAAEIVALFTTGTGSPSPGDGGVADTPAQDALVALGGSCSTSAQCANGYCANKVCTSKLGNGTACGGADQCGSGYCTDGVCCVVAKCVDTCAPGGISTCAPYSGFTCAPNGTCRGY
ncbi:MAG: LamG domain-containing protein [Polyangia bacterium]